ncbi:hypothetical protein EUX98_g7317 [Antrodiella citrinella]|uniref:Uncharacterized protein n=1 Tax=Antrodiella citrinella TaxID=2447956 RepID=A0A4S4MNI7_9APHY|nr:hypothetical protein EUX98_g7317 [Antrodiella citrinella]
MVNKGGLSSSHSAYCSPSTATAGAPASTAAVGPALALGGAAAAGCFDLFSFALSSPLLGLPLFFPFPVPSSPSLSC